MKFYVSRHRTPTIPLVSLIDILAILLIFFIATTTFKKRESLVNVNLPQSSQMKAGAEPIRRVALTVTKEETIHLGGQAVPIEGLAEALRQFKAARPNDKLELKADQEVPIGLLVKIWDAASQAEVKIDEIPLRIQVQPGGR
ncbi:MAG: biopolymer transporter ExbD [Verrucomicrobiales bacterium]|nr:biopolymer transporter ExbD [Verrucomicrobiales bacterium]